MTDQEKKCGSGEITVAGVTADTDFTVDIYPNPLNLGVSDRTLWRPPIFDGCICSIPIWVFDILKCGSAKFSISGEVDKGTMLTCKHCSVVHVGEATICGACVSCDISFKVDNLDHDFYLEYKTKEVVDKK